MDGGAWYAAVHGVAKSRTRLSEFTFTFHFHALEKEMATHSSVLAWRIPGKGEPGRLPSMGTHRVGHDWSDLAVRNKNKGPFGLQSLRNAADPTSQHRELPLLVCPHQCNVGTLGSGSLYHSFIEHLLGARKSCMHRPTISVIFITLQW